jgi:hypothetical protein
MTEPMAEAKMLCVCLCFYFTEMIWRNRISEKRVTPVDEKTRMIRFVLDGAQPSQSYRADAT